MRARGAGATDLAVIVVAADDGVKPQTEEAIDHAKAAEVPIIVAVNKIDKEGAQPERVRTEMTQHGLQPADWGGETGSSTSAPRPGSGSTRCSTRSRSSPTRGAQGQPRNRSLWNRDRVQARPRSRPVVTILIQRGTLRVGDALRRGRPLRGACARCDFTGVKLKRAMPGQPVEVLGFDGVPGGEPVRVVRTSAAPAKLAGERANRLKTEALRGTSRRASPWKIWLAGPGKARSKSSAWSSRRTWRDPWRRSRTRSQSSPSKRSRSTSFTAALVESTSPT